jgi:hypothetical protein
MKAQYALIPHSAICRIFQEFLIAYAILSPSRDDAINTLAKLIISPLLIVILIFKYK